MKRLFTILCTLVLSLYTLNAQEEKLELEGAIQLGSSDDPSPDAGTIKWSGTDFLGWNGEKWVSLTTGVAFDGEVTDIDGNVYRTIKIGDQVWMAENLRTSKYSNGTIIPNITLDSVWESQVNGAWCWHDNNPVNSIYGKLYNWYAVDNFEGICPTGYKVPSRHDWTELIKYLDPHLSIDTVSVFDTIVIEMDTFVSYVFIPSSPTSAIAGAQMKESGNVHWKLPNTGANNSSGFTSLPASNRYPHGGFYPLGEYAYWWSSTASGNNAWIRYNDFNNTNSGSDDVSHKKFGYSVRCLKQ